MATITIVPRLSGFGNNKGKGAFGPGKGKEKGNGKGKDEITETASDKGKGKGKGLAGGVSFRLVPPPKKGQSKGKGQVKGERSNSSEATPTTQFSELKVDAEVPRRGSSFPVSQASSKAASAAKASNLGVRGKAAAAAAAKAKSLAPGALAKSNAMDPKAAPQPAAA
ncbi:unnamed protein product, partial [Polarella glacialis]